LPPRPTIRLPRRNHCSFSVPLHGHRMIGVPSLGTPPLTFRHLPPIPTICTADASVPVRQSDVKQRHERIAISKAKRMRSPLLVGPSIPAAKIANPEASRATIRTCWTTRRLSDLMTSPNAGIERP